MYHYFYKITNKLNNHYYYGIHSTDNLKDGYMGSGRNLRRAINKYGIENFEKEIIKFFETREECAKYEQLIVNKNLVLAKDCYNIALGGEQTCCKGTVPVIENESGICIRVPIEDKYKDEFSSLNSGFVTVIDKTTNKTVRITTVEYYSNKDKYLNIHPFPKNSIFVYKNDDKNKVIFMIDKSEFDKTKYTIADNHFKKEHVCVKDKDGKRFFVSKNDPRYLSGELVFVSTGYKFTEEQKQKLRNRFKELGLSKGEKNSQYGTKWISKDGIKMKIKKEKLDEYINNGWHLGMK